MAERIKNSLKNALDKELSKDEKLSWVGVPDASVIFAPQDAVLVPFTIMWGGFAIFWEWSALKPAMSSGFDGPVSIIFPLWGVPFVLVGLYLMFGRFIVKRIVKQNMIYGITNKRVIVLRVWPQVKVISEDLRSLGNISKTGNDEIGSLFFGGNGLAQVLTGLELFTKNGARTNPGDELAFIDLPRPREPYDIVLRAREITGSK